MGFALSTEIEIDAPIERVWAILTDFAAYPSWNPFVLSIAGSLARDAPLVVQLRGPGGNAATIKPHLTRVEPGQAFAWRGSLLIPALFTGEHAFELTALGSSRVRLVHSERFSGVLVPLFKGMLNGPTRNGFVAMNEAVKARAEASS